MASIEWAAGFFDGEGCITIDKNSQRVVRYYLHVGLTNTSTEALKAFQEITRAPDIGVAYVNGYKAGWRPAYRIQVYSTAAVELLKLLAPHLVNKRMEAELALDARNAWGTKTFPGKPLPEEVSEFRLYAREELQRLKKVSS